MRIGLLPLVGVLACGGSPEEAKLPAEAKAPAAVEAAEPGPAPMDSPAKVETKVPPAPGDVAPVVLVWTGIGDLHKSFFTTQGLVTTLAEDLHGTVAPPANVHIRFDNRWHKGWIQLQLRPETLRLPISVQGDVIRLQDLAPITTALATYRSKVAGRYDMRVESFHVGIESYRGPVRCVFGVGGLPPPDGKTLSLCVEINSQEYCGTQEADGVRFQSDVAEKIRRCLG